MYVLKARPVMPVFFFLGEICVAFLLLCSIKSNVANAITVAILAQGTNWAVAATQAFFAQQTDHGFAFWASWQRSADQKYLGKPI